jgi:hypothetical protein
MRIAVTLDKDVANSLCREMFRSGTSLRAAVNHFLRMGLRVSGKDNRRRFAVHPKPLGLPLSSGHECLEEILENLDGIAH